MLFSADPHIVPRIKLILSFPSIWPSPSLADLRQGCQWTQLGKWPTDTFFCVIQGALWFDIYVWVGRPVSVYLLFPPSPFPRLQSLEDGPCSVDASFDAHFVAALSYTLGRSHIAPRTGSPDFFMEDVGRARYGERFAGPKSHLHIAQFNQNKKPDPKTLPSSRSVFAFSIVVCEYRSWTDKTWHIISYCPSPVYSITP